MTVPPHGHVGFSEANNIDFLIFSDLIIHKEDLDTLCQIDGIITSDEYNDFAFLLNS